MDFKNHILFETEGITQSDRVLYTPSDFAKKNLLFVQETGILTSLSAHKSSHKKLDSYLLLEVIEGKGSVTVSDNEYSLIAGDTVMIDCNEYYHHISNENELWTIAWVHFNGSAAAGYYDMISSYCKGNPILTDISVRQLVQEILPMLQESHLSNELTVGEKLQHTLNMILQQAIENEEAACNVDWNHIREYVNEKCQTENFEVQNYLQKIEKKFHLSEEEICAGFASRFGVTLDDYIIYRKLTIVKEKLRFTTQAVDNIAAEAGIKNLSNFTDLFKKYENMTPTEYRRSWAQWIRS